MRDWVVTVKRLGEYERKRVFVEDIEHEDEAAKLALLKLGANSLDFETLVQPIHERVSLEDPQHNWKELYEQGVIDLAALHQEWLNTRNAVSENLDRAEKAEDEINRLVEKLNSLLNDLSLVRTLFDNMLKVLKK